MLRIAIVLLLFVHGVIHAMGVAKGFGLAELPQLTLPISRGWAVAWGLCAVLLVAAAGARLVAAPGWWMLAAPGLVLSQVVVIAYWRDARFGTIANLMIALPVLVGFGTWRFAARVEADLARLAARAPTQARAVVEAGELEGLPPVVARWLERAGVVGKPRPRTVHLDQRGALQTARGGDWLRFRAEQWFIVPEPAFLWVADVRGAVGLDMAGEDLYLDGKGTMRIEVLSLFPVVDEAGARIDQGALVRYLAETIWFPAAALEPYVRWEAVDDRAARATMRSGDVEASGVFRFDADGDVVGFDARRYRDAVLEDWRIACEPGSARVLDGVRVPTRATVSWTNAAGETWTWLRLEIEALERDVALVGRRERR